MHLRLEIGNDNEHRVENFNLEDAEKSTTTDVLVEIVETTDGKSFPLTVESVTYQEK